MGGAAIGEVSQTREKQGKKMLSGALEMLTGKQKR
jgi:hypothetical protein